MAKAKELKFYTLVAHMKY